jgi:hypothetical protein
VVRRLVLLAIAAVLAFGLAVPSAFAWGNGGDAADGDRYGTHDWLLDEAIRVAGVDGSWVDVRTALLATDDPDNETDRAAHSFRENGLYGGAPQKVADLYYQAVTAYAAGDIEGASRSLGLMSHYYTDILNPFHSTDASRPWSAVHGPYEHAVSIENNRPGKNRAWIAPAARVALADVRARTVAAAHFSRAKFPALIGALKSMHEIDLGQPIVSAITRQVMSRAVNDLADIVSGVPSARGLAKAPATVKLTVSRRYVTPGLMICAFAECKDAAGKPIEGASVAFTWPGPAGSVITTLAYTGPSGVAHNWQRLIGTPYHVRSIVQAVASSSGSAVTKSTWFVKSVTLKAGSAGLRAKVSDTTPARESTVTARAIVRDRSGHAVVSLPVTFVWKFKTSTVTRTVMTDSSGVARVSLNIGACARGYRAWVTVKTTSAGHPRSAKTSFAPH